MHSNKYLSNCDFNLTDRYAILTTINLVHCATWRKNLKANSCLYSQKDASNPKHTIYKASLGFAKAHVIIIIKFIIVYKQNQHQIGTTNTYTHVEYLLLTYCLRPETSSDISAQDKVRVFFFVTFDICCSWCYCCCYSKRKCWKYKQDLPIQSMMRDSRTTILETITISTNGAYIHKPWQNK